MGNSRKGLSKLRPYLEPATSALDESCPQTTYPFACAHEPSSGKAIELQANEPVHQSMRSVALFFAVMSLAIAGDVKLPSGRVLKNTQVVPIFYTTGIPSSLALKYETAVDIKSKKAVCDEIDELWPAFRIEVEKGKYQSAVIMVAGPATGLFVKSAEQRNFVFEKKDGTWNMTLPSVWQDKKEPKK